MTDAKHEPIASSSPEAGPSPRPAAAGSPTRGFLFADLREYTRYVEGHGAVDAAELLVRYRAIVRQAVVEHDGAEIKTEGDSFYVVFQAVSSAVLCGLAIVAGAGRQAGPDGEAQPAIPVGVGIHAGETIETPDGYVGSAVNIAARICAIAKPGEVLVSDTVRALTQTVLPVSFTSRGRQKLKGVTEPVAVFAVVESADAWAGIGGRRVRPRMLVAGALVVAGVIVVGAFAWYQLRPPPGLPPGPWTIGLDMPLSGPDSVLGIPMRDAVKLAIDEANAAGGIGGAQITLAEHDANDSDGDEASVSARVADPRTVAIIGPLFSGSAEREIPITNAAGLLQCSPTNTEPNVTKPRFGALDLRKDRPDRINYVRTTPSDDIQGTALASFIFNDLDVAVTLVVENTDFGSDIADQFSDAYAKLGGTVVRRSMNPDADPRSVLAPLDDVSDPPRAVFYGGSTSTGAPELRQAIVASGHAPIPLLSYDTIADGPGTRDGSYIQLAGASAVGTYMAHASVRPPKASFAEAFRAAYGTASGADAALQQAIDEHYTPSAYACAQVVLEALRAVAKTGPSSEGLREAVRAYTVDPTHRFETVIGSLGFDANGDSLQQFVTFYRVDPSAAGGKGDWVIAKQQDYGPAP